MTTSNTRKHLTMQMVSVYRATRTVSLTQIALALTLVFFIQPGCLARMVTNDSQAPGAETSAPLVDTMINVSAASYIASGEIAADSIVSGFGPALATGIAVASSLPLPTELDGIKISVKDSEDVTRFAPLFFVSPAQINYLIPPGTAEGAVSMVVTRNSTPIALGSAKIIRVWAGLFAANANGQGVPAALALRVRGDGSLNYEAIAQFNTDQARFNPVPIEMGAATDQVYLVLYGTGIRHNSGVNTINAAVGGTRCEVLYAGPAPGFAGLDQINLRLPRQLAGRGDANVVLTANARISNTVSVRIN